MKSTFRHYSIADHVLQHIDLAMNHIFCPQKTQRPYPADSAPEHNDAALSHDEKHASAAMMRVNHAGEMAAQALYHGQSLTARDPNLKERLHQASVEESDHLHWCRHRLEELGEKPSLLDPFWYAGSFAIGVAAGIAGDRWNLGFLSETERQVVRHLDSHLEHLPAADLRSRAIATQMREDELGHAELAESLGAAELPPPVKALMKPMAKVMTSIASKI